MLLTGRDTAEEAAESLWETGVKHVVIKCGRKGCYIRSKALSAWFRL